MISYDILQLDFNNKSITFAFDNDQNKSIKINMKDDVIRGATVCHAGAP